MALQLGESLSNVLLDRLTVAVFAVVGAAVALAEWGLLPDEALLAGAPALAAAMLLDTFLYNEFLVRTGGWIWLEIYACIYLQAAAISAAVHLFRPDWIERVAGV